MITKIHYALTLSNLFSGMSGLDEDASAHKYEHTLEDRIKEAYPDAQVSTRVIFVWGNVSTIESSYVMYDHEWGTDLDREADDLENITDIANKLYEDTDAWTVVEPTHYQAED